MYGAHNLADMALTRGAGEMNLDFEDDAIKTRMENSYICAQHQKELIFGWKFVRRHLLRRGREKKIMCGIPNDIFAVHKSNDQMQAPSQGTFLQKNEVNAYLKQTGVLLHIGIRKNTFIVH